MKQFVYKVHDPLGLHARPAGQLAKLAKQFPDTAITVTKGEKTVKATMLMMLMGLSIKDGDEITVCAEGAQEDEAIEKLQAFFETI